MNTEKDRLLEKTWDFKQSWTFNVCQGFLIFPGQWFHVTTKANLCTTEASELSYKHFRNEADKVSDNYLTFYLIHRLNYVFWLQLFFLADISEQPKPLECQFSDADVK